MRDSILEPLGEELSILVMSPACLQRGSYSPRGWSLLLMEGKDQVPGSGSALGGEMRYPSIGVGWCGPGVSSPWRTELC